MLGTMLGDDEVLGIIPARGGSKRAPRKNIRDFRGKPLIVWSIESGMNSRFIDKLVVSTDDEEISEVAKAKGIDVVERPDDLSHDFATNEDVMRHIIEKYDNYNWLVLLQPTSPLREGKDIDSCLLMAVKNRDGCVSYYKENKNGAVYVCRKEFLEAGNNFDHEFATKYNMPQARSLDIDYDWQFE